MMQARTLLLVSMIVGTMLAPGTAVARGLDPHEGTGGSGAPPAEFPGDGQSGPVHSYTDHGDGTATDDQTGLTWELKNATGDIHGINRVFTISEEFPTGRGSVFGAFLWTLNNTCSGDQKTTARATTSARASGCADWPAIATGGCRRSWSYRRCSISASR